MAAVQRDSVWLTDPDIDELTWNFLNSDYAGALYIAWPLDRRLEGFLRSNGRARIADDGDLYNLVLQRVMTHIPAAKALQPAERSAK